MNKYKLSIEIAAHSQAEAEAKLQLIVQLAAFFTDFDFENLAATFIRFKMLHFLKRTNSKAA